MSTASVGSEYAPTTRPLYPGYICVSQLVKLSWGLGRKSHPELFISAFLRLA